MKRLRSSFLLVLLVLSFAALVSSCGDDSKECTSHSAEPDNPSRPLLIMFSNAQEVASGTLDAAKLFRAASLLSEGEASQAASASHKTGDGPVMSVITKAINISLKTAGQSSGSLNSGLSGPAAVSPSCPSGGTMETGPSGNHLTATFHSCQDGSTLLDGSMSVYSVGNAEAPPVMIITIPSLRVADSYEGFDIVFSSFSMNVTNIFGPGYEIIGMTIKLNGDASGKIDATFPGSLDISCENYTGVLKRVEEGETLMVSGRFKTSACFSDWLSVVTRVPIFFQDGADCPTSGDLTSYYDSNAVKVVINSNQQQDIYFDSALTDTFSNCREAEMACF